MEAFGILGFIFGIIIATLQSSSIKCQDIKNLLLAKFDEVKKVNLFKQYHLLRLYKITSLNCINIHTS